MNCFRNAQQRISAATVDRLRCCCCLYLQRRRRLWIQSAHVDRGVAVGRRAGAAVADARVGPAYKRRRSAQAASQAEAGAHAQRQRSAPDVVPRRLHANGGDEHPGDPKRQAARRVTHLRQELREESTARNHFKNSQYWIGISCCARRGRRCHGRCWRSASTSRRARAPGSSLQMRGQQQ